MIDLAVDFPQIASYLRNAGWAPSVSGEIADFWTRDEGLEVLVPKLPHAPDFDKRIELLTRDLQRIEERPAQDIRNDITRQFLDITDIRADHEYGEQCIPLEAGHKLFTTAKGLVVSATASTLQRRGYFGRSMPKRARDQARRALVGHTRPGSYVVPIINNARLPDLPSQDEQPRLIESVEEAAFERRVTTNLARALGVLQEIAVVRENKPSVRDVHDAVGEGLSFEMCRAIVRPLQEQVVRRVDITFAWAPGVAPPRGVAPGFEFPSGCLDSLKDVAGTLRRDPSNSEEVVYGIVVGLRSRSRDEGGRVEVETLIDGAKRLVRLDLNERQYEIARACHKRSPVIARGTLHRNPGRMASMEVANFEQDLSLPIDIFSQGSREADRR
ncbi:hypothetical protein [Micromonospora palomenae]|uniref:hypothetical protein n=1 Tax=Micromonospora palomenae TaxID=1461247 RepID=UPI003F8CC092